MSGCAEVACAWLVAVSTWLTPLPQHASGLLVNYGSQYVIERAAAYRDYDLSPYRERCGLATVTPVHLGRIAWVRAPGGPWYGPCLVTDTQQMAHFYWGVWVVKEIAEVTRPVAALLGFRSGMPGEVWIGACPPDGGSQPTPYLPPLEWYNGEPRPIFGTPTYPAQELPAHCAESIWN